MQYAKVRVRVNELQTQELTVPPWEFMVLQAIHSDNAQMLEVVQGEKRDVTAEMEYDRLELKYKAGFDDDDKRPWVARVFGQYGEGISKLQSVMDAASKPIPKGRKSAA